MRDDDLAVHQSKTTVAFFRGHINLYSILSFFQKHKKKRKTSTAGNFSALHLINDPQGKMLVLKKICSICVLV